MADNDPQDTEILELISAAHGGAIEPRDLVRQLCRQYDSARVIESLQRAIERGKISLNSDGMVVAITHAYAAAA